MTAWCKTLALTAVLSVPQLAAAQSVDPSEVVAMQMLQQFLTNPEARRDFAKGKPDAQAANTFFEKFPPYAQSEMLEIIMQIMRETHGKPAIAKGNVQSTYDGFSPAVKTRIASLQERLKSDPQFNTPQNLDLLKRFFPAFLGAPPS